MKRWSTILIALMAVAALTDRAAVAQDVFAHGSGSSIFNGAPNYPLISGFDSMREDTTLWGQYGFWNPNADCRYQAPPCWDFYENGRDYARLFDYAALGGTDMPQGASALYIDWSVFSAYGWGGSSALQHALPDSIVQAGIFYDFSDFTEIGIDYNNQVPTGEGGLFRIKVNEASDGLPSTGMEDWYSESNVMLEAQPGWGEVFIPLETVPGCCGTGGFNRPGWSGITGNNTFDLDKIAGFQLEFVAQGSVSSGDSTLQGTVIWDNFRVRGVRYNLMSDFEGGPSGDGKQSNAGTYTVSTSDDAILGDGSLRVDYSVVGDQGWGGEVDLYFAPPGGAVNFGDMASRTAVTVFYKTLTPANTDMTFALRVYENSDGNQEIWNYESHAVLTDDSGRWRRFLAPFDEMSIPTWSSTHDGVLDRNKITQIQFVLYTGEGNTSTGSILFDRMTGYGFQETDNTAPEAVTGLTASAGDYQNIISWTDVPGEDGETYAIYASHSAITDVSATGVQLLAEVDENNEVYIHNLYYPASDGELAYFYAVIPSDRVGNQGPTTALATAVTNTARGIATIHLGTPGTFAADADLGDWAGIAPIHMEVGTAVGHVSTTSIAPTNAADLSGDVYLAMDSDYLYFAFDVNDSMYDPVPDTETDQRWMYDGAELYIGLYDGRNRVHVGYEGNAEPDFKFYVYKQDLRADQITSPVHTHDNGNYFWKQKTGGWMAEGRVALTAMQRDGFPVFTPLEGMRLPLDIVIMDDDTGPGGRNRETIFAYSFDNNDNSYQSPTHWWYTWIGTKYAVGVERLSEEVPTEFALHQNYPNPFNPTTTFRYDLKQSGPVSLRVFNILGQEVMTLVDTDQAAGTYEVRFDASGLTSGMYVYQLRSGHVVLNRKMLLVR